MSSSLLPVKSNLSCNTSTGMSLIIPSGLAIKFNHASFCAFILKFPISLHQSVGITGKSAYGCL